VKLETPVEDPLRVETCSVTQINKFVSLMVEFILLVALTQQDTNNKNKNIIISVPSINSGARDNILYTNNLSHRTV
jgi:hypothetical protein